VFFNNLNPTQTLIEKLLLEVTSDALGIREECLLPQNAIFSLAVKIALIHFETPEIAKMLHNVYIFEETFHSKFAVLALNVHGRIKTISVSSRLVKAICDLN
jgi:hypothetical protein